MIGFVSSQEEAKRADLSLLCENTAKRHCLQAGKTQLVP